MEIDRVRMVLFLGVLGWGVWQDFREREISYGFLMCAGGLGSFLVVMSVMEGRAWWDLILSCGVGGVLLGISRLTGGGVGEGDGWFFVISGLFLNVWENIWLLFSGLFLCCFVSLPLAVWGIWHRCGSGGIRLPFLPFLLPGAIWSAIRIFGSVGVPQALP